ncbi:MAG: hypothetical protein ABL949_01335 [Fimbriimonadaceae bacterium]
MSKIGIRILLVAAVIAAMCCVPGCGSSSTAPSAATGSTGSTPEAKPAVEANAMVGTWKMEISAEAMKGAPKGTKAPEMSMTFKEDLTFDGKANFMGKDSTVSGTYTIKDKAVKMVTKMENGKPSKSPDMDATLAADMKSFDLPGGMSKMVKQ